MSDSDSTSLVTRVCAYCGAVFCADASRMHKYCSQACSKEVAKERLVRYREKIRSQVFAAYGTSCACCGETNQKFLTIDHTYGDGAEHRRDQRISSGDATYSWLVRNEFPPGFQTLCFNCNSGRARNGGICPHKSS